MSAEHNQSSLRVYAETLTPMGTARAARLLRRFGCDVVLAVRPPHLSEVARAVSTLEGEGVKVTLWPMIADAEGRWPNVKNAAKWVAFTEHVVSLVEASAAPLREVLFDLEPHFGSVRALTPGHFSPAALARLVRRDETHAEGRATLVSFREALRARGVAVSAAIIPLCAFATHWERVLGTPVTEVSADNPSVMAYTTIYEGWSRRVFSRSDALALLYATARWTRRRYGPTAGISLGAVGTGAFQDEPVYRSPDELLADVVTARAAGISALTLFDLGGVLRRGPAEAWLSAFTSAPGRAPHVPICESRRMRLFRRAIEGPFARAVASREPPGCM